MCAAGRSSSACFAAVAGDKALRVGVGLGVAVGVAVAVDGEWIGSGWGVDGDTACDRVAP